MNPKITLDFLYTCPDFTVLSALRREVEDPGLSGGDWDMFAGDGHSGLDTDEVRAKLAELGIGIHEPGESSYSEPELCDDSGPARLKTHTDDHAVLAALRVGKVLCKVPDFIGGPYRRWLLVGRIPPETVL